MRVITTATPHGFACAAADWLCDHLHEKAHSVVALPTGNTPLPLYSEVIVRVHARTINLDKVKIFNLDEYCGLPQSDPRSFAAFLRQHLTAPVGLADRQLRLLRGDAPDIEAECCAYDAALANCGGIDLCILGLGVNGHVAFNEPGSDWHLRTHVVDLSQATRAALERQMRLPWRIPVRGVTMGIKTLMESRHVLLLLAGPHKEAAKAAFYCGVPDIDWPVTSLLSHPSVTVIEYFDPAVSQ